jgi:hypothetical protein
LIHLKKNVYLEGLDDIALSLKKSEKLKNLKKFKKSKTLDYLMIKVKKRKILLLPGDGIGPEVIGEVKKIINWFNDKKSLDFEIDQESCWWLFL